jgi:outer membrane protein OmpA-like peptidoglycan-associated protein
MKIQITFIFIAISTFSIAQVDIEPPFELDPNKCYVRYQKPDEFVKTTTEVKVREAYKKLEVTKPVYELQEKVIVLREGTTDYIYAPPEYETVLESVYVRESHTDYDIEPAKFKKVAQQVEIKPQTGNWEYGYGKDDLEAGRYVTMQYVETPKVYSTVMTEVLEEAPKVKKTFYSNGITKPIKKQVVTREATLVEVQIPAIYDTILTDVLVEDAKVVEVEVPAEYKEVNIEVLNKKGGEIAWKEVDCELMDYNMLPIFYDFGSDRLTPMAEAVIDERLVKLMKENPYLKLELAAHTDSRGSAGRNKSLSERRANAVVNYLTSKGIPRSRLVAKGYGESKLLNRCKDGIPCSENEHEANRRTEFRVISN